MGTLDLYIDDTRFLWMNAVARSSEFVEGINPDRSRYTLDHKSSSRNTG